MLFYLSLIKFIYKCKINLYKKYYHKKNKSDSVNFIKTKLKYIIFMKNAKVAANLILFLVCNSETRNSKVIFFDHINV